MKGSFALIFLAGLGLSACNRFGSEDLAVPAEPAARAAECEAYGGPVLSSLKAYEGLMHEHSSFSDGDPLSVPADYYRIAREQGYAFVGGSEHSDTLDAGMFATLHASCDPTTDNFDPTQLEYCFLNPTADKLQKWQATAQQAADASGADFLAIRGFEWTSDVYGHINVYFSQNFTNAKTDGGYALTLDNFWDWFTRDPGTPGLAGSASSPLPFGGGADALAHFNHPGDKCFTEDDPTGLTNNRCDWNSYTLIPAAVERLFAIEAYNDGNRNDRYFPFIVRALDAGWRLAFVGSEDEHFAEYAVEHRPKTVTLAKSLSAEDFREAWLARRVYALSPGIHARVEFEAAGHPMGSQLNCKAGSEVPLNVNITQADGSAFAGSLQLFTSGGETLSALPVAAGSFNLPVKPGTHWYFVRVHGADGQSAVYIAPVWITGR